MNTINPIVTTPDFINITRDILACPSVPDLTALLRGFFKKIQVAHYAYYLSRQKGEDIIFSDYPSEWVQQYVKNDYALIDPVISKGQHLAGPTSWQNFIDFSLLRDKQHLFFEDAAQYGIHSGITMPLHSANPDNATLHFIPDNNTVDNGDTNKMQYTLFLLAGTLDYKLRSLFSLEMTPAKPRLTSRERDVLIWLALGKSETYIAHRMSLSVNTACLCITSILKKLNVVSKRDAVTRGVAIGLIPKEEALILAIPVSMAQYEKEKVKCDRDYNAVSQHYTLSKRQLECATLLLQGKKYKEIGRDLQLSMRTVETHIDHMKRKLDCSSRTELIIKLLSFINR